MLTALNRTSPPRTWYELLELARAAHGADLNGDGVPDYGICMERRKGACLCCFLAA